MKIRSLACLPTSLLALMLLAGCSSPSGDVDAPTTRVAPAAPSATATMPAGATAASAVGVVQSLDVAAGTITIAHGAVDALKWPAMTMTFQAPDTDLGSIKQGDHVAFEFSSTGMNGTITKITRR